MSVDGAGAGAGRPSWPGVVWRFSRPHTIVGTTVSIIALYVIAENFGHGPGAGSLAAALLAGWLVNLAIVGINQLEDIEIDRINKPGLPLASGELAVGWARVLVFGSVAVALAMGVLAGAVELLAVALALLIGFAYSVPPVQLKRFPVAAMVSITVVRTFAVNLGAWAHFAGSLHQVPAVIWALTAFTLPFAAAIAVLKDVPDIAGDRAFAVRTFSVRFGAEWVFRLGVGTLAVAYLAMAAVGPTLGDEVDPLLFSGGHLVALGALLAFARKADSRDAAAFTRFYMRIWLLFFWEYVLVAAAVSV